LIREEGRRRRRKRRKKKKSKLAMAFKRPLRDLIHDDRIIALTACYPCMMCLR